MESNQSEPPSPQSAPSPSSHSVSQAVWPSHSESPYEINDATSSDQYNDDVPPQVEYPVESSGTGVDEYSASVAYSEHFEESATPGPTNGAPSSTQMINSLAYEQEVTGQEEPFSPQPSTSSSVGGAYQVSLQSYDRISPVDDYHHSPATSNADDHLQQYETMSHLAEQSDHVSSGVRLSQSLPSQSHAAMDLGNGRESSPSSMIDQCPSPLSIDQSSAVLQQHEHSPMSTIIEHRLQNGNSNGLSARYLSPSDMVDSSIVAQLGLSHSHHHHHHHHPKSLLSATDTQNMVVLASSTNNNHVLRLQNQRIESPVSQSQRISSPSELDYEGLHPDDRGLDDSINSVGVSASQRAMSPDMSSMVAQSSGQSYSPVELRLMSTSPSLMVATTTALPMQNYVSSSTGPMEVGPSTSMASSGAVLDSTVDSTVETTDPRLGAADEVADSSGTAYIGDLDVGVQGYDVGLSGVSTTAEDMGLDSGATSSMSSSHAGHLSMSESIDATEDIDTTVNTSTLDSSETAAVDKMIELHNMGIRIQDGLHPTVSLQNNGLSSHLHSIDQLDTIAISRPRRFLHRQKLLEQEQQQRNRIMYPSKEFWCEECNMAYDVECTRHRIQTIFDKPVLSRAWASLPGAYLAISKVGQQENGDAVYGVFAKKPIPKRTKFGPVEGVITKGGEFPLVPGQQQLILQIELENGVMMNMDTSDEGLSNWMRFVRPAENYAEQNMVLIQSEQSLYFMSIKQINPRSELKVVYSQQYAERRGLKNLELNEEQLKALEDQENAWPCFECNKRFSSSDDLQKHLNEHDSVEPVSKEEEENFPVLGRKKSRPRGRPPKKSKVGRPVKKIKSTDDDLQVALDTLDEATNEALARRPRGRPPKKFRLDVDGEGGAELANGTMAVLENGEGTKNPPPAEDHFACDVCQKEFPRQYSLQRHQIMHSGEKKFKCPMCDMRFSHVYNRNRHVQRHRSHANEDMMSIARPIKSLFRKKHHPEEWLCTHCDLTFDNSSLLNLHTLTHAAEDVGLDETVRFTGDAAEFAMKDGEMVPADGEFHMGQGMVLPGELLKCPQCTEGFVSKKELIEHASVHGKVIIRRSFRGIINPSKPFKCELCYKSFASEERLLRHNLVHGSEDTKPLQCEVCFKRFLNNSALACHIKVHSGMFCSDEKKYYECPICKEGFDQIILLKDHVHIHCINGVYTCPCCQKGFEEYNLIRKHIRAFHSEKRYPCEKCDKVFPRPDKLKLHMLRHSDHREFLCANCGKQFKRKDKLKEHMKRMHSSEREARLAMRPSKSSSSKKFIPKVSPTDYHRFIYKCHTCLLGFKRRGMLVNHLAKRHPDIRPESVPELNLPILKTTRDYYCQYCEKVYKSSSKRKAHILKNHPGAELPMSNRRKGGIPEIPGLPNPTFSQTVGSITTHPHNCDWCHKQYASKAKLLQHQRKKHLHCLPQTQQIPRTHQNQRDGLNEQYQMEMGTPGQTSDSEYNDSVIVDASMAKHSISPPPVPRPPSVYVERDSSTPVMPTQQTSADSLPAADLLTQAMSELTQTLSEYKPSSAEFHLARMTQSGPPTMVNPSPATTPIPQQQQLPQSTTPTLEQTQLSAILAHYQQLHQQQENNPPSPSQEPPLSPASVQQHHSTSPVPSPDPATATAVANAYITVPRTWATATFANYPAR